MTVWPRITIVTPSYNQADYIEETIQSVLDQRYPDLEYIIIDGGSSDGSVDIIRRYERWLAYWVSEPDGGQPNGINKGIRLATGEIVAFINSDDAYLPNAFVRAAEAFIHNPEARWLCGACLLRDDRTGTTILQKPEVPEDPAIWLYQPTGQRYCFPQQGTFLQRTLIDEVGPFREDLQYCFDYELYQRLLLAGHQPLLLDETLAMFRIHGESKTAMYASRLEADDLAIADLYYGRVSPKHQRRLRKQKHMMNAWRAVDGCFAIAAAEGHQAARRALWSHIFRDPRLLQYRPVWGALQRWYVSRR